MLLEGVDVSLLYLFGGTTGTMETLIKSSFFQIKKKYVKEKEKKVVFSPFETSVTRPLKFMSLKL